MSIVHKPHDYEPVLMPLVLSPLANRRIAAGLKVSEKTYGWVYWLSWFIRWTSKFVSSNLDHTILSTLQLALPIIPVINQY